MTRRRARDEGVKRECERRVREERVLAICEGAQSDRPLNSANALLDLREAMEGRRRGGAYGAMLCEVERADAAAKSMRCVR
jgi:hypothetical protein